MLKSVANPIECGISQIKSLSNGAVLIQCKTNEALNDIEKRVNEHDAENYTTKETMYTLKGQIKFIEMSKKYTEQELSVFIGSQIEISENDGLKVLKTYSDKNTRNESYNAIVEMSTEAMEEIIQKNRINIDWDECKVHQYIQVKRCYKCLGFNHMAKTCNKKLACSKCAGEHSINECDSESLNCINCIEFNMKNNVNINTGQHAFSRECQILKQNFEKYANNKSNP